MFARQVPAYVIAALVVLAIYTQGAFGWIITSVGAVGVVLALSLQDILRNFFAGIYVLVERPFRIGDTIQVDGHAGVVQEISFRVTQLRTDDGREVIVPNATLMTSAVVNLTRYPSRSAKLTVTVPVDQVGPDLPERIRELLAGSEHIADEPPAAVLLRGVADGKGRYEVTVWGRDRDRAAGEAIACIRATAPEWEVQGA